MPFIKRDFIDDLTNRVDIITLINKRVPLTKKGKDYKACCPFHQEKTPSFNVSVEKQAYYCFGCGEGGRAIDFVKKFDNLEFIEAVERVAHEFGITIEYDTNAKPVDKSIINLRELIKKVSKFYTAQLKTTQAKIAVDYAKNRDISGQIAKRFELGFAPDGWDNLLKHFKNDKIQIQNLITLGLIVENQKKPGQYYDRFRKRLIFPIHNTKGEVIGFGGRVLSKEDKPKYLNSSESVIFNKSHELYGLNLARKHSKSLNYLLVVEGYMDVVALHQGGISACVATLGTATSEKHLHILKRNTTVIIFCFDGDTAGKKAAIKALNTSLPIISANMEIKFLFLPDNEDPDSLIRKEGKVKFKKRIKQAITLSEFLFIHLKEQVNFKTIEGKTKFLEQANKLVETVNYKLYQQQLIQGLALEMGESYANIIKNIAQKTIQKPKYQAKNIIEKNLKDTDQTIKNSIAKLISIILTRPNVIDDKLLTKIKDIPQTKILQEIITSIDFIDNPSTEILIRPFKGQIKIYNRLRYLAKTTAILSPKSAKKEINNILNIIQNYKAKKLECQKIADSNNFSSQQQEEIVKNLSKKLLIKKVNL